MWTHVTLVFKFSSRFFIFLPSLCLHCMPSPCTTVLCVSSLDSHLYKLKTLIRLSFDCLMWLQASDSIFFFSDGEVRNGWRREVEGWGRWRKWEKRAFIRNLLPSTCEPDNYSSLTCCITHMQVNKFCIQSTVECFWVIKQWIHNISNSRCILRVLWLWICL